MQVSAGADQLRAVALVKPFRLGADAARFRLAVLHAHQEHAHRIGLGFGGCRGLVHLVAAFGGTQVGQAGASNMQVGGIGMVNRCQDAAFRQRQRDIDILAKPLRLDLGGQGLAGGNRLAGQFIGTADPGDSACGTVRLAGEHAAFAFRRDNLYKAKGVVRGHGKSSLCRHD